MHSHGHNTLVSVVLTIDLFLVYSTHKAEFSGVLTETLVLVGFLFLFCGFFSFFFNHSLPPQQSLNSKVCLRALRLLISA